MEVTQEEDDMIYIHFSKKHIDDYILKNDYKTAFNYLILVLTRLNDNQKRNFIEYYSEKLGYHLRFLDISSNSSNIKSL
jgi:hypothetical protein